jgi:hypothetical protein
MKRREFLSAAAAAAGASLVPGLASAADPQANVVLRDGPGKSYPSGPPQAPRRESPPVTVAEVEEDKRLREELVKSLWPAERAFKYMERFGVIKGCNYVPAYAHSHAHMWFDYREGEINKELAWAKEIGINSVRMFVPCFEYFAFRDQLLRRWDRFMDAAGRQGMTVMPTFSLSILDPDYDPAAPGALKEPAINFKYAIHGGQWRYPGVTSYRKTWPESKNTIKEFIQGFVARYAKDERIVAWDLINEAPKRDRLILAYTFQWAREVNPIQPLTSSWEAIELSDVYTFHTYGQPGRPAGDSQGGFDKELEVALASKRPMLCTECMARTLGNTLLVILPFFARHKIGWYEWGLCAGSAQYHFPWGWPEGSPPPPVWFHCLLYPDGTPYKPEELELIRSFKWQS